MFFCYHTYMRKLKHKKVDYIPKWSQCSLKEESGLFVLYFLWRSSSTYGTPFVKEKSFILVLRVITPLRMYMHIIYIYLLPFISSKRCA